MTGKGRLVTRKEAAAILRVKPRTLATWESTGRYGLRCYKVGCRAMYHTSDLEDFILRGATR